MFSPKTTHTLLSELARGGRLEYSSNGFDYAVTMPEPGVFHVDKSSNGVPWGDGDAVQVIAQLSVDPHRFRSVRLGLTLKEASSKHTFFSRPGLGVLFVEPEHHYLCTVKQVGAAQLTSEDVQAEDWYGCDEQGAKT
jgi:hypothetical protein